MTAVAKPKLRAVPAHEVDDVMLATVAVTKAQESVASTRTAMTTARLAEQSLRDRFNSGDETVTVDQIQRAATVRGLAEEKYKTASDREETARIELAKREHERATREYEAKIEHAQSWRARIGPLLARFAAVDEELSKIVEACVDVIADADDTHKAAEALESTARPVIVMRTRNIEAPTIDDARHLVRIFIARNRIKAGRDALCNEWLDQLDQPDWRDPNRQKWNAAVAALDEVEKTI